MSHDRIDQGSLLSNDPREVVSFRPSLNDVLFQGSHPPLHHTLSKSVIHILRVVVFIGPRSDLQISRRFALAGELVHTLRFPLLENELPLARGHGEGRGRYGPTVFRGKRYH